MTEGYYRCDRCTEHYEQEGDDHHRFVFGLDDGKREVDLCAKCRIALDAFLDGEQVGEVHTGNE